MLGQISDGSGGPAGTYTVIGSNPTIQVYAGNKTRPANQVFAYENVYGVTYGFTVDRATFMGAGPDALAGLYAGYIQAIGGIAYVQGIAYAPDVNQSGLLTDFLFITVGTDDGAWANDVEIPLAQANAVATFTKLDAAWQKLVALGAPAV